MAATGLRKPVCSSGRGDAALRTASLVEVDRLPHHEEPVSLANSGIDVWALGFYQFREGGRLWI